MFFDLFKKKNKENAKIQELEQTIRNLSVEVDSLKRSISEKERQPEKVVDKKSTQVPPKEIAEPHGEVKRTTTSSSADKNLSFPDCLASYLPADHLIKITGYGNGVQSDGKRYRVGMHHSFSDEPHIQYHVKDVNTDAALVFGQSFHPFISKYTSNSRECAQNMLKNFSYSPYNFEVSQEILRVSFDSGYYNTGYIETHDYMKYEESYHESYHDGGGSGYSEWYLYAAPGKNAPQELLGKRYFGWCTIPECKGYWFEDDHLYLVEPWEIPGIFEFYYGSVVCPDYGSDDICREIGVRYSENSGSL